MASVSINTISALVVSAVKEDARFWPEIDDPNMGSGSEPAKTILAVPIMGKDEFDKHSFTMPKGVVIVVNKANGGEFTQDDVENLRLYNCLISKMIDVSM